MTPEMDPAQRLHALDCVTTNTADDASPELVYGQSSSATLHGSSGYSAPSLSRREYFSSESGSPKRQQSPLRHSVSDIERPDLSYAIPLRSVAATDPTKSPTDNDSRMRLTGDKRGVSLQSRCSRRDSSVSNASPDSTPTRLRTPSQASVMEATDSPKSAASTPTSVSRFSFLSTAFRGLTSSPATSPGRPVDDSDDLINLNIDHTLHSMTSLTDRSTFSPAAFKNLQMVATGLLHRFQDAYIQRTIELRELRAEQAAQSEEQSEAETKMQHLRMQLAGMAQKAAEQEDTMQTLMSELAREKKLRTAQSSLMSGGSSVSEDLAVEEDQRKKWRKSGWTSRSDTSYDTDEEGTEEASVFSTRSRSPTATTAMSDVSPVDCSPHFSPVSPAPSKAAPPPSPSNTPRPPQTQVSAFQKLFKGLSVDTQHGGIAAGPLSCQNCKGQDASVAWDTVSLLKDENKGLKGRVGDLEAALEGALDVVNGVGL